MKPAVLLLAGLWAFSAYGLNLQHDATSAPEAFAASEIRRAAGGPGLEALEVILTTDEDSELGAEGYRIERDGGRSIRVTGGGSVGTMYGGLDVAEALRLGTWKQIRSGDRKPHIEERGFKFNIPLDLRTPSYSDCSDAAQENLPEMWSEAFWQELLDDMARNRYNALTLWNLHPFPSLVKVPEYPEVALDDVLRARRDLVHSLKFSFSGSDMFRPELLPGAEVVRRLTIDDKIAFWRHVMEMARDRGVAVYWFTWNAFLHGAEGRHGLDRSKPDDNMIRYFRASVREMVRTYPLLAGMGITAGEHMGDGLAGRDKETWLWETYGEGIRDALEQQPDREFRLIHRHHMSDVGLIFDRWKDYPSRFELSYKYAVAHMYSITKPIFIREILGELGDGRRTWLTVRNDDIYSFRWGDPGFARDFIRNLPPADKCVGFYMGPDGYILGRDFLTLDPPGGRRETVQGKQWYSFMLWGRLAYDPTLSDRHFQRVLATHFPEVRAARLDQAWRAASAVFPLITRFAWGRIDLHWFPEACCSSPGYRGFYTVGEFIERDPMPGSGVLGIKAWRRAKLEGGPMDGATPLEVADDLAGNAATVRRLLPGLRSQAGDNAELIATLNDLEMFALLGDYYAAKIRAACDLAIYDSTADPRLRDRAVSHLEEALRHWEDYARQYAAQYQERVLYNRVGFVDRTALIENAREDIRMAREWKPGTKPGDQPAHPASAKTS